MAETPSSTEMQNRRFSCVHEDGASDQYIEQVGQRRVAFQCLMGTRCYQRPNKYVEIECVYAVGNARYVASPSINSVADSPESTPPSATDTDAELASAVYAPAQITITTGAQDVISIASPTSSEPKVLTVNVVLPTIALRVTDGPNAAGATTILSIEADAKVITGTEPSLGPSNTETAISLLPPMPTTLELAVSASLSLPSSTVDYMTRSAMQQQDTAATTTMLPQQSPTAEDSELFSIIYMTNTKLAPIALFSSPPASIQPSLALPEFTGSQPPLPESSPFGLESTLPTAAPATPMPPQLPMLLRPNMATPVPLHMPHLHRTHAQHPLAPPVPVPRTVQAPPPPTHPTNVELAGASLPPIPSPRPTPPLPSQQLQVPLPVPLPQQGAIPTALYSLDDLHNSPRLVSAPVITLVLSPAFGAQPPPLAPPTPRPALPHSSSLPIMSPLLPPLPPLPANTASTFSRMDLSFADTPPSPEPAPTIDYPHYTPIIPFISNGRRKSTPTHDPDNDDDDDDDSSDKGAVNSSGIASILQNMFSVPSDRITFDGTGQPGQSGSINVVIVDPSAGKKGLISGVKGQGISPDDDDDDDLLDDTDGDEDPESATHSLNVDRARNRGRGRGRGRGKGRVRLSISDVATSHTNGYDSDTNSGSGSDSDERYDRDSDEDSDIETEDDTAPQYSTPTRPTTDSSTDEGPTPLATASPSTDHSQATTTLRRKPTDSTQPPDKGD